MDGKGHDPSCLRRPTKQGQPRTVRDQHGERQQPDTDVYEKKGRPGRLFIATYRWGGETGQNPKSHAHDKLDRPAEQDELNVCREQAPGQRADGL